jgi:DNA modification methylase
MSIDQPSEPAPRPPRRKANRLDGKRWLQNSISVWADIRKAPEEARFKHPAMFPGQLVERLIDSFLPPEGRRVLDPFAGSGSTVVTAARLGLEGVGFELSPEYVELGRRRLAELKESVLVTADISSPPESVIHLGSASDMAQHVAENSVDLCITSPPYWDILNQRRTADMKAVRHYGNLPEDLGIIADYDQFLDSLADIFRKVLPVLKPRAYCCVVVMDLRKKNRFFPFHSDLAARLQKVGYRYDDLIIWNRQTEYNNLRPLGYPSVFRINKVHEFVLLMQKPEAAE